MNEDKELSNAAKLLNRLRNRPKKIETLESDVYPSKALTEKGVFPICELEWKYLEAHRIDKKDIDSLPYDLIKSNIDFTNFSAAPEYLMANPTLRVRKRKKTMLVPARIMKVPNTEIYFLRVKKLSIAQLERQFRFNLFTVPLINLVPFPSVLIAFLVLSYCLSGQTFYSETEFLPGLAVAISLASLLTVMWTHLVQHSEKTFDTKCRALENDIIVSQLEDINRNRPT